MNNFDNFLDNVEIDYATQIGDEEYTPTNEGTKITDLIRAADDNAKQSKNKHNKKTKSDKTKCEADKVPNKLSAEKILADGIIFLCVYVVMSQTTIIDFIAKYVTCIQQTKNGNTSLLALVVYGTIIFAIYFTLHTILHKSKFDKLY